MNARQSAVLQLAFAGVLWGFSFSATVWALQAFGPIWTVALRFILVALIGLPLMFLPRFRPSCTWAQARLARWPGLLMGLTMVLQTWGLQYTTATKSSFITVTYVLMVPFIERAFFRKKLSLPLVACAILGVIGTAFICQLSPFDPALNRWNAGDLLTLACALTGALQIIFVGEGAARIQSSFVYNMYQSLWSLAVAVVAAPAIEPFIFKGLTWKSAFGLAFTAVGSTLVAFMLQVRAQKVLSNSLASLLCLLESPFAALFAALCLGEVLSLSQWMGACLILLSALGAIAVGR